MIQGVLFDFSGTLFRFEPGPGWPTAAYDDAARDRLVTVLTEPVSLDAGTPRDLAELWERRDLDLDVHREVYFGLLTRGALALPAAEAGVVYDALSDPEIWRPYPDTLGVLADLRAAGVPVAVVSNIAWDVRAIFRQHGVEDLVNEYVLSYVEGAVKPDPKIFRVACDRLGVPPTEALMIGDSRENDGGADAVGCATVIVDPLPTVQRPSALREACAALL